MTLTDREIRAKAHAIADEIETRAAPRIAAGMSRDKALMLTIMEMGGKISVVKG
jgi:hypothetical protein